MGAGEVVMEARALRPASMAAKDKVVMVVEEEVRLEATTSKAIGCESDWLLR